nr:retroviral-like aspartic protease family protein [uncultured Neokomagataea sp.]
MSKALTAAIISITALTSPLYAHTENDLTSPRCVPPTRIITLPLRDDGGYLSVPATINGHALSVIVDTGSQGSLITSSAVKRMKLPTDTSLRTALSGAGGAGATVPDTRITTFQLGSLKLGSGLIAIGELPGIPLLHPPVEGLIGADVLSNFDLEFDVPHHQLTLWRADPLQGCNTPQEETRTIPAHLTSGRMTLAFTLDGITGTALLDSGARSHIISLDFAHKLGLTDNQLAQDPGGIAAGVDLHPHRYYWHHFKQFTLGPTQWDHPTLTIAPLYDNVDMLLGSDWFAQHTVWVSYTHQHVFIR